MYLKKKKGKKNIIKYKSPASQKKKRKSKKQKEEKEYGPKPHPPYHRPTRCDPTARMNGASRHDEAASVAAAPPGWVLVEHSARQDHDHHAGGGSSVGWNCLRGNARSDTVGLRCGCLRGGFILILLLWIRYDYRVLRTREQSTRAEYRSVCSFGSR